MFLDGIQLKGGQTQVFADRYQGGQNRGANDHPYVKGHFYVFFGLPSTLFTSGGITSATARNYLLSSAEDFTPPADRQMITGDVPGMGGTGASFITGQQISRDFSITYKDYWGAPIFRIHRTWTGFIDPHLGVSVKAGQYGAGEYKGTCMIIQTKPVARQVGSNPIDWSEDDIIKIHYFDGVQCLTDLNQAYNASIKDNSFVSAPVQYKFDGYFLDETNADVLATAVKVLNSSKIFGNTEKIYTNLAKDSNIINGMTPQYSTIG